MMLTDPIAEHDALVLLVSATFIGCRPLIQTLPPKNAAILRGSLSKAFAVLGLDQNDEHKAQQQLNRLLGEVDARRRQPQPA
jgi:hypothetical protein